MSIYKLHCKSEYFSLNTMVRVLDIEEIVEIIAVLRLHKQPPKSYVEKNIFPVVWSY